MFRETLRTKMQERNLTAKDLASLIETDEDRTEGVQVYRVIENWVGKKGSIPNAERAVSLAQALGTTVEYLVTGKDESVSFEDRSLIELARKYRKALSDLEEMDDLQRSTVLIQIEAVADSCRETVEKKNG
jgi:hypothetical protein